MRNLPVDFVNLAISLYGSAMKSPIFSPATGKRGDCWFAGTNTAKKPSLRWQHLNPPSLPIPPRPHIWAAGLPVAILFPLIFTRWGTEVERNAWSAFIKTGRACLYQRTNAASDGSKTYTEVTTPKSVQSTNSTTPANMSGRASCRYFIALCFYTAREPRRSVTLDPRL